MPARVATRLPARYLLGLLTLVALLSFSRMSAAQATTDVSCAVSQRQVEVGEVFMVTMKAMVENGPMPHDPRLAAPSAFSASSPRVSTRTMAQMNGGGAFIQRGIGASWQLRALKEGTFTIPSPTVRIGGRTITASGRLRIHVGSANAGSAGAGPTPTSPDADDPLLSSYLDDDLSDEGRKLSMPSAPDRYAFVTIVADKTDVVVGEQVTLYYYFYRFNRYTQIGPPREPALTDFLRFPLDRAPGVGGSVTTKAGDRVYEARLIDAVAVFPVRAGKLQTGTLELDFTGRSFSNTVQTRVSNDLTINVREPPKQGRPVGYRLGDTGHYEISASVTPRRARVGDSVAVEVRLSGIGAVPGSLKLPERTGVEWLAPEKHESVSVDNGRIAGFRTFRYAVRFNEAGEIALGNVELPHWDPEAGRYREISAPLGVIRVAPRANVGMSGDGGGSARAASDDDPFAALSPPRTSMRAYAGKGEQGLSPYWLWSLVAGPPLLVLLGGASWRGAGGLSAKWRKRASDPAVQARRALAQIDVKGDAKDIAAGCERALHLALEAASGLRARALLLGELAEQLRSAGLDGALADDTTAVLADCSTMRFEPKADAGHANALMARTRKLVRRLLKASSKRPAQTVTADQAA